eukprot:s4625_g5.t1
MTVTAAVTAMDDPAALRKLLGDCLMSSIMIEHIIGMGYTTIALVAHAVGEPDMVEAFTQHLSLVPEGEEYQPFSPQTASIRRAVKQCYSMAFDSGRASAPDVAPVAPVKTRLSASEAKELKDQFNLNYPGELLTPASTPSLAFLSFIKEAVDSKTLAWVPWKKRSSELDELEFTEHRRPRNDKQLLRSILADGDVGLDELPEARVDTGGPVESALCKFQCLLANALAITGACHLLVIKRFHAKFLELATAKPRDPHLRAPTIHEVIDAERAAWQSVSELMVEGKWTLNDSLSEVAYCRQVFHTTLSPRPKMVQQQNNDDRRRKRLPSPPKATPKAKAKSQPKPENAGAPDASSKYLDSWPRKTTDGRGICIRFNTGRCKSGKTCRYAHVCPIPNAKGEPCGGQHPAGKHKSSPH